MNLGTAEGEIRVDAGKAQQAIQEAARELRDNVEASREHRELDLKLKRSRQLQSSLISFMLWWFCFWMAIPFAVAAIKLGQWVWGYAL